MNSGEIYEVVKVRTPPKKKKIMIYTSGEKRYFIRKGELENGSQIEVEKWITDVNTAPFTGRSAWMKGAILEKRRPPLVPTFMYVKYLGCCGWSFPVTAS
jgi:hypothetical protein